MNASANSRVTDIEKMVDKATRLVQMKDQTPQQAAVSAVPADILSVPLSDLRTLAIEAIGQRVNQRVAHRRDRDNDRTEVLTRAKVKEALATQSAVIQKQAAVLARVHYTVSGRNLSLLDMADADHRTLRATAEESEMTHRGRKEFHTQAIATLKKAKVKTISELPAQRIADLALKAKEVWG